MTTDRDHRPSESRIEEKIGESAPGRERDRFEDRLRQSLEIGDRLRQLFERGQSLLDRLNGRKGDRAPETD